MSSKFLINVSLRIQRLNVEYNLRKHYKHIQDVRKLLDVFLMTDSLTNFGGDFFLNENIERDHIFISNCLKILLK